MKHKFLIAIIPVLFLSFSNERFNNEKCAEGNEKVLLLQYWVDSDFKVIKDYKDVNKRFRYLGVTPVDCPYPVYHHYNKTFEVNGDFNVTDKTKIIFWTICNVTDITIPFHYEDIKLYSQINDSTVRFTWFNKKHVSIPWQEVSDSFVSIEKEGERVIKYTKVFHLLNYGLIYKKNIFKYQDPMIKVMEEKRIQDSIERNEIYKRYKIEQ